MAGNTPGPDPRYTQEERIERQKAAKARYRERNRDKLAQRQQQYNQADPQRRKAVYRKSRYGITSDEYDALLEDQQGLCAICRQERPLVIDHCHQSQRVRGLLCNQCNLGIGYLDDNPTLLHAAIEYLCDGDWVMRLPKG